MIHWKRRHVLCGIAAVAASYAGCIGKNRGAGFTRTEVEGQELVVEFDESLEPDEISVVDPNGEGNAETSVSAGVTQASFEIAMPYTSGKYQIIATQDGDEVAEETQEISPDLEILDVGVGANRMDEMPEDLHFPNRQVIVETENSGTGPERMTALRFLEGFPNPSEEGSEGSGIFDEKSGMESSDGVVIEADGSRQLFSTEMPFAKLEQQCSDDEVTVEATTRSEYEISETISTDVEIRFSGTSSDECEVDLELL